jgi:hypothetical protein
MAFNIEALLWYLFLADSVGANLMAWFDGKWYKKNFPICSKWFPLTKAFAGFYLFMVLWVGYSLHRLGVLWW